MRETGLIVELQAGQICMIPRRSRQCANCCAIWTCVYLHSPVECKTPQLILACVAQALQNLVGSPPPQNITATLLGTAGQVGSIPVAWAASAGPASAASTAVYPISTSNSGSDGSLTTRVGQPLRFLVQARDANGVGLSKGKPPNPYTAYFL